MMFPRRPIRVEHGYRRGRDLPRPTMVPGGPHELTEYTSVASWDRTTTYRCQLCSFTHVVRYDTVKLRQGLAAYFLLGEIESIKQLPCPAKYKRQWPSDAEV